MDKTSRKCGIRKTYSFEIIIYCFISLIKYRCWKMALSEKYLFYVSVWNLNSLYIYYMLIAKHLFLNSLYLLLFSTQSSIYLWKHNVFPSNMGDPFLFYCFSSLVSRQYLFSIVLEISLSLTWIIKSLSPIVSKEILSFFVLHLQLVFRRS